jgi:hypothetical protein
MDLPQIQPPQNHKGVFRYLTSEGMFQEVARREMAQMICLTNNQGLIEISDVYRDEDHILVLSGILKDCMGRILSFDTHNLGRKCGLSLMARAMLWGWGFEL